MIKKSKIIAGGILITSAIGATTFAIIDPYNIFFKKDLKIPEKSLKVTENKKYIDSIKELNNISLKGIKDGTYIGISKGYGGDIKVKVTVEKGKIKNIEVLSHSETPKYYENGKRIIDSIIKENSINVDAISGATLTSNGIINAVKDALSKAGFNIEKNNKEINLSNSSIKHYNISKNIDRIDMKDYKLIDGEYIGEAIGFKGNIKVKVIVNDGKIFDIKIISHSDDDEFFNKAKGVVIKILKNQGTVGVDTISGATYSSKGILNAVNSALNKVGKKNSSIINTIKFSKNNNTFKNDNYRLIDIEKLNKVNIGVNENKDNNNSLEGYIDGEYIGEAIGFKGNIKVKVIVNDGKIFDIKIISHSDDDEFFNKAKSVVIKILKNQGTVGVDTISGATYSSKGILNAVNEALYNAKYKNYTDSKIIKFSKDKNTSEKNGENLNNKPKLDLELPINKNIKYLDGTYEGIGYGFTGNPIKSEVIFENNKIKSINVATVESGNYGDDGEMFRNKAMEIVYYLKKNPKKTINDLLLHDRIIDEIIKSDNYYEKGKELIGNYAEKLKDISKENLTQDNRYKIYLSVKQYLKEQKKINLFDTVSGATYSAKGIAKSVQDAMNKAANDFKTGNIISNIRVISPKDKMMIVNKEKKLDLSKLKVKILERNGGSKEIFYDKFKENNIEIYDKETKAPIYDGMDLSKYQDGNRINCIIKHKNSLRADSFKIIPIKINENYIVGIEYSIDNGKKWSEFDGIEKYKNNISFKQELKVPKEYKDKDILIRLVSCDKTTYVLHPDEDGVNLKVNDKEYYLEATPDNKKSNKNIPTLLRVKFRLF